MKLGSFSLVLHAHLPWVLNHGVWPHGTNWIYEATAETYIPLLKELNQLLIDGFAPKLTIDISPVLCEMLADDKFKTGFVQYCDAKAAGARTDLSEFQRLKHPKLQCNTAKFWDDFYTGTKNEFVNRYNCDLIAGFRELLEKDVLDIITCAATHGYGPLLSQESSIHGQYYTAVNNYKKHFLREPVGTWVPECAYRPAYKWKNPLTNGKEYFRPGVEYFLSRNNLKYFFIDTPLLMGTTVSQSQGSSEQSTALQQIYDQFKKQTKVSKKSLAARTTLEPYLVYSKEAQNPVAFFTREESTGILVWSGIYGYPGSSCYLDFHKKHYADKKGGGSGLRYWRVLHPKADLGAKTLYDINEIPAKLNENGMHFHEAVKKVLRGYKDKTGKTGMLVSPYDAELFGHWWFEGIWWIGRLVRMFAQDDEIEMTHCREYFQNNGMPTQSIELPEGSWGAQGGHAIWINKDTTWTWEHIYEIEPIIEDLVTKHINNPNQMLQRSLKQLCRENLIMQASDWQFLISTWSARDYAEQRMGDLYNCIKRLIQYVNNLANGVNLSFEEHADLEKLEQEDNIFPELELTPWVKNNWKEKNTKI